MKSVLTTFFAVQCRWWN